MKARYRIYWRDLQGNPKVSEFSNKIKMIKWVLRLTMTEREHYVHWESLDGYDWMMLPKNLTATKEWKENEKGIPSGYYAEMPEPQVLNPKNILGPGSFKGVEIIDVVGTYHSEGDEGE